MKKEKGANINKSIADMIMNSNDLKTYDDVSEALSNIKGIIIQSILDGDYVHFFIMWMFT